MRPFFSIVHHPADLSVHAMDHGRVQRHFDRLKFLLLLASGSSTARHGPLPRVRFSRAIAPRAGSSCGMMPGSRAESEQSIRPSFSSFHNAPGAKRPNPPVTVLVKGDVLRRRLQRVMRREKRQIEEERLLTMRDLMFRQHLYGMLGDGRRVVITAVGGTGGRGLSSRVWSLGLK